MTYIRMKQLAMIACVAVFLSIAKSDSVAVAQTETGIHVQTINGLKQRRLYELAVGHAERMLARDDLESAERVDIIVALIDTLGQKAYQAGDAESWQEAKRAATDWLAQSRSPRKILIAVQSALVDQLQIERWVREVETESAAAGTREKALAAVSGLAQRFDELQAEARVLLNRRPGSREQGDWFRPNELLTLRYNLEYQQARTLLHRATLYGDDQELSRNDVLALVEQRLESVQQSIRPDQPLWWTVQADRIAVARTLKDFQKASRIFGSLPKSGTPSRNLVTAEWIRALISAQRLEDGVVVAGTKAFASNAPRLDLARVELYVAMAGKSNEKIWQQRALDLTRSIEETHGSYWGRLANLSVVGTAAVAAHGDSSLDLLIRLADEAQRKKQWAEAIKALDTAYTKAVEAGRTEVAWKLGFRAASIEQSQGRHEPASRRFEALAQHHRDWHESHTASLMACWNLTRVMKNDSANVDRYELMLKQLIDGWPESTSANQARIWLAAVRRSRRNWPSAIGLLLDVNASSPLFGKAVEQLRVIMPAFLQQQDVSNESKVNVKSALVVRLAPLLDATGDSLPDNWAQTRAQVVLQLAELKWLYGTDVPGDLSAGLQQIVTNMPGTSSETLQAQAIQYVDSGTYIRLSSDSAQRLRQLSLIYRGLLPRKSDADLQQKALRFRTAVKQYAGEIGQLPEADQKKWKVATIDALAWTGETLPAVLLATEFAGQYSKDSTVQIRLAELLTLHAESDNEFLARALGQWRKVGSMSRKNSDSWFHAKYQVAKLMADQGQNEEALKRLNFIKAIPPGWRNAPNARQFDELYQSLGGK